MDGVVWALADSVSGAGVPVLFGAARGGGRWANLGAVAAGGAAGVWLTLWPDGGPRGRAAVELVGGLASVAFSGALLFRHAGAWDPDLGAALCGIPLFHAACAPSAGARGLGAALAALSVAALCLGCAAADTEGGAGDGGGWRHWWLLALCAAHAAARPGARPLGAALGVALQAALALWPGAAEALAARRQPRGTMVVLGLALVTSAMRQGERMRRALPDLWPPPAGAREVSRGQRALLLAVAWALLLAYEARWARWEDAGWAAGALVLARGASAAWG